MNKYAKFYIDGQWVDPIAVNLHKVVNPATESACAQISLGSEKDVDRAVKAARAAFAGYSRLSREERIALFERVLAVFVRRKDEIAQVISMEMGAPITFAKDAQTATCIAHLHAIVEILKTYEFERRRGNTLVCKEPIGVVGLITPWNWPLNQVVCKVLPALAAGCTIVLKPSEIAPLDATIFAEILEESGLPPGVFNLVNGLGPIVGEAMSRHPGIDMVSFTGSTRAGVLVAKAAADSVKRVAQELGGKSANIILDDADLESAVKTGVEACFVNSGQTCDAPTRMLVPKEKYEAAVNIAVAHANRMKVGVPSDPNTQLGPVASEMQFEKIQRIIGSGITQGARLAAGGLGKPKGLEVGYYVKPTIFADVTRDMDIVRDEIFGPVVVIMPYADEQDAIDMANDSEYGLAAYVQSTSLGRAHKVARELRAGSVFINYPDWDFMAPFGGYKKSGNGREGGPHALSEYLEMKAIVGYGSE